MRGYELDGGEFVVVDDDELEKLAPEKSRDIDLRRFVPVEDLDPLYFVRTYYLTPAGDSTKSYRLLAAAMERAGRAGIAIFVMRGVEYLAAIVAEAGILRAETLRFEEEVRSPEEVGLAEGTKAAAAEKARMRGQIRKLAAGALDEAELEDAWQARLDALVRRKRRRGEACAAHHPGIHQVADSRGGAPAEHLGTQSLEGGDVGPKLDIRRSTMGSLGIRVCGPRPTPGAAAAGATASRRPTSRAGKRRRSRAAHPGR